MQLQIDSVQLQIDIVKLQIDSVQLQIDSAQLQIDSVQLQIASFIALHRASIPVVWVPALKYSHWHCLVYLGLGLVSDELGNVISHLGNQLCD